MKEGDHLGDYGIDGIIILTLILKQQNQVMGYIHLHKNRDQSTQRHVHEDFNLLRHRFRNPKSHTIMNLHLP